MGARDTVVVDALAARYGGPSRALIEITRRLATDPDIEAVVAVAHDGSTVAAALESEVRTILVPSRVRGHVLQRLAWEAWHLPKLVADTHNARVLTWSGMLPR